MATGYVRATFWKDCWKSRLWKASVLNLFQMTTTFTVGVCVALVASSPIYRGKVFLGNEIIQDR
jgi:hypothetical protein